jgi:hypothetical protein
VLNLACAHVVLRPAYRLSAVTLSSPGQADIFTVIDLKSNDLTAPKISGIGPVNILESRPCYRVM